MLTDVAVRPGARREATAPRPSLLILTEDSKPQLGGIAEYLHRLALALGRDCDVRIVSSVSGTSACDDPSLPVRYVEVPWFRSAFPMAGDAWPPVRKANTLRWMLRRNARARGYLDVVRRSASPDVVLLGRLSPITHPWCAACESAGIPYDVLLHGLELIDHYSRLERARQRRYLRRARRIFAVSRATAELALAAGADDDRLRLMPPGVDPDSLVPPAPADRARLLGELGLAGRRFLLSVSALRFRKGIDLAIEAVARLAERHDGVDLCVVGSGPEELALRALAARAGIAGRVHFAGAVDDRAKLALLAECEALVMPNRRLPDDIEGFGIVFLEAAALGKPVVGGDNGGVRDAVDHGETGFLVETGGDAAPVAEALDRLLSSPSLAAAMGRAGRERVMARFRWETTSAPLLAHVREQRRAREER
jgi:phosphatidylinositol alpha-1,6-mannosyltransferase